MSKLSRIFKHLCAAPAARTFNARALEAIGATIAACELQHSGEIMFAVESDLPIRDIWRDVSARDRALAAFANLHVWNTAQNNGVLIYVLLAEHRIEIIADRGFDAFVSVEQWRGVCQLMEGQFQLGEHTEAVKRGIEAASELIAAHFPQQAGTVDEDELPNPPRILR